MMALKIIIIQLLLLSISYAQEMKIQEEHIVDAFHKDTSKRLRSVSDYIDDTLFDLANYLDEDNNTTIQGPVKTKDKKLAKRKKHADEFFLSDKFLTETDHPYLRITPESVFNSKESNDYKLKFNAHLPLSRSRKRFKIFIGNLSDDNYNDIFSNNKNTTKPEVGVNYFQPETYGINSKYSVGFNGVYPFARARFSTQYHPYNWDIELVQTFKYSSDDHFQEQTQVFLDTSFYNLSLFRLQFERSTQEEESGMTYNSSILMFWQPSYKAGLTLNQTFFGQTKYRYAPNKNSTPTFYKETDGINDYKTTLSYRQNFYRKWLFYVVEPSVNFSAIHDYEPNYGLRLSIDMFFGGI